MRLALIFICLTLTTACGPVGSTVRISDAEASMERARVADAHERAPYEYHLGAYYLHKAKEEWGYSDFEAARDYATEAKRSAEAALLKAKEDPWNGSPVPQDQQAEARKPPKKGALNTDKPLKEQLQQQDKSNKKKHTRDVLDDPNGLYD
jgi:hypothetical protein